jgi:hypothetical protein
VLEPPRELQLITVATIGSCAAMPVPGTVTAPLARAPLPRAGLAGGAV